MTKDNDIGAVQPKPSKNLETPMHLSKVAKQDAKIIIEPVFWNLKNRSPYIKNRWDWENGTFIAIEAPLPMAQKSPGVEKVFTPAAGRMIVYGVEFSREDIDNLIGILSPEHPNTSVKPDKKRPTKWDWKNMTVELNLLRDSGQFFMTFGAKDQYGFKAAIGRYVADHITKIQGTPPPESSVKSFVKDYLKENII